MRAVVKENLLVSPVLVFFLVNSMQVGIGILGFQSDLAKEAGHDGWIAVVIAGLSVNVLIWLIYKILITGNDDLIGIHNQLFGKWLGGTMTILVILHIVYAVVSILGSYINVIQAWMFPQLSSWVIGGAFLILAYAYVSGGFRTVTGICFLSVVYGAPLLLTIFYPLNYSHPTNLLPMMNHETGEIFSAAKQMTYSYVGFQLILIYYPFIKNARHSQKWAHFGNIFTITMYLLVALTSFIYYNQQQLGHVEWATLTLWKIINITFVQRFEYIGIAIWLFMILPNICLGLWCASRSAKRLFSVGQRHSLVIILGIVYVAVGLIEDEVKVTKISMILGQIDFYYLYIYIPLLFVFQSIVVKFRNKKRRNKRNV